MQLLTRAAGTGRFARTNRIPEGTGSTAVAGILAALVALLTIKIGLFTVLAAALFPILALSAIQRPVILLYAAVVLMTTTPYSLSFGLSFLTLFRVECLMAIGYLFLDRLRQDRDVPRFGLQDWIVIAYAGAFFASPLLTEFSAGPTLLLNAALPLAFYFAARQLTTEERHTTRWLLLAGGSVGALSVLYELVFVGAPLIADASTYRWLAKESALYRPGGIYTSPPAAAAVLSLCLALASPLFAKGTKFRPLAITLGLTLLAGSLVTFTRAPLIGLAAGAVLITVVSAPQGRRLMRVIGILMFAIVTLAFVIPAVSDTRLYKQGIERPGQLSVRESYWRASLPIVASSPQTLLVGHGAELLMSFRTGESVALPNDIVEVPVVTTITPHNQYVLTAIELGVSGALLLIAYLLAGLLPMLRIAIAGKPSFQREAASLAAGIIVVAAGLYASCLLMGPTVAIPLALALGLCRAVQEANRNADRDGHSLAGP